MKAFAHLREDPEAIDDDFHAKHAANDTRNVQEDHDEDGMSKSSSDISIIQTTQTSDNETVNPNVIEANIALRPACYANHYGYKGKGRAGQNDKHFVHGSTCGVAKACYKAIIFPQQAVRPLYRLQTEDAEHDLKRWATNPNARHCGGEEHRSKQFLLNDRFTYDHILQALSYALEHIRYEHAHLASLVEYAKRRPYYVLLDHPIAPEAELKLLDLNIRDFHGAPKEGLVEDLVTAAIELDYLRLIAKETSERIVMEKMRRAKMGNRWEIEELLRLEEVGVEWVKETCWLGG